MPPESNSIAGLEQALSTRRDLAYWLRLLLGLALGGAAALFLAWFMHYLIASSQVALEDSQRVQMLDFVRLKREEQANRKDRKPKRPELNKAPDVPPMPQNSADNSGQQLMVSAMSVNADVDINQGGAGFGAGEGDYLPIVKVAPIFPRRALERGIFGPCLVRYTVTTSGTVKDVEVIEEECSSPLFHKSSVDAALRFKYKPRVIDGVAVEVIGAMNRFYYEEAEE
jgi:protein TonB